jgi:K+-transporting ATPase ATPase C chain
MFREIALSLRFTLATLVLFGVAYPALVLGAGRLLFPAQASGSLIARDGQVIGSALIGQPFSSDGYFIGRPSAVDYDAASTGGSNLATSSPDYQAAVAARVEAVRRREGPPAGTDVPADLVQASGAGLDPHISPAAAHLEAPRVARARGLDEAAVRALIASHVEPPWLGLFGAPRVNVLQLNLSLDEATR